MSPDDFKRECQRILAQERGHARHRAFDRACEEALRSACYGEGVEIFEAAVKNWHRDPDPYPYGQACPDCERE